MKPVVVDSVSFWDMASERFLELKGEHSIREMAFVPLPGDRVTFEGDDGLYSVIYRELQYSGGACSVMVCVQPVVRERPKPTRD